MRRGTAAIQGSNAFQFSASRKIRRFPEISFISLRSSLFPSWKMKLYYSNITFQMISTATFRRFRSDAAWRFVRLFPRKRVPLFHNLLKQPAIIKQTHWRNLPLFANESNESRLAQINQYPVSYLELFVIVEMCVYECTHIPKTHRLGNGYQWNCSKWLSLKIVFVHKSLDSFWRLINRHVIRSRLNQ